MAERKPVAKRNSLIHAYGLFWRRDEINWNPGAGRKNGFCLLGRSGANAPRLRVIDARYQVGLYILYGNYGPYYVGIADPIGRRLKQHTENDHKGNWDRFCWFGFKPVLKKKDLRRIQELGDLAQGKFVSPKSIIKDVEALLIHSMALENIESMKFATADEWTQIKLDEVETFLSRLKS